MNANCASQAFLERTQIIAISFNHTFPIGKIRSYWEDTGCLDNGWGLVRDLYIYFLWSFMEKNLACMCCLLLFFLFGCTSSVTVDGSTEYQTMDGFGACEFGNYPKPTYYPVIFDELGIDVLRFQMYPRLEPVNDNDDPFVIDWNNVDINSLVEPLNYTGVDCGYGGVAPVLKAAHDRGIKLVGSIWSPPAWMKTNGNTIGGKLSPGLEDEFSEFLVIWIKGMERYHGVHINSISIQNEPSYSQLWESCVYSQNELRDVIKVVGARFAAEGIKTKIHGPDTQNLTLFTSYSNAILNDPVANGYVDTLASHTYSSTCFKKNWEAAYAVSSSNNKKLWMTEYAWNKNPIEVVHNALYYGNVNAYFLWELFGLPGGFVEYERKTVTCPYIGPNKYYYNFKQFSYFIKPGAIRICTTSDDNNILVTSFIHKTDNDFIIVAINKGLFNKNVDFTINSVSGISALDIYRTSDTENTLNLGQINISGNSFSYIIPKNSTTTFTGKINCIQEKLGVGPS